MATKKGPGRPPLGEKKRELIWGSADPATKQLVIQLAEDRGVAQARIVSALIEYGLAHLDEVDLPMSPATEDQGELPLREAS